MYMSIKQERALLTDISNNIKGVKYTASNCLTCETFEQAENAMIELEHYNIQSDILLHGKIDGIHFYTVCMLIPVTGQY